jgi:hypothetical protein
MKYAKWYAGILVNSYAIIAKVIFLVILKGLNKVVVTMY